MIQWQGHLLSCPGQLKIATKNEGGGVKAFDSKVFWTMLRNAILVREGIPRSISYPDMVCEHRLLYKIHVDCWSVPCILVFSYRSWNVTLREVEPWIPLICKERCHQAWFLFRILPREWTATMHLPTKSPDFMLKFQQPFPKIGFLEFVFLRTEFNLMKSDGWNGIGLDEWLS